MLQSPMIAPCCEGLGNEIVAPAAARIRELHPTVNRKADFGIPNSRKLLAGSIAAWVCRYHQRVSRHAKCSIALFAVKTATMAPPVTLSTTTLKLLAAEELQKLKLEMQATPLSWATGNDCLAQVQRHLQTLLWIAQTYRQIQKQFPSNLDEVDAEKIRNVLNWLVNQCKVSIQEARVALGRTAEDFIATPKYYYSELRSRRKCLHPAQDQAFEKEELLRFLCTEVLAFLRMEERLHVLAQTAGDPVPGYWQKCCEWAHKNAVELTSALIGAYALPQVTGELQECSKEETQVWHDMIDGSKGRVRFGSSSSVSRTDQTEVKAREERHDGCCKACAAKPVFVVSDCTGESAERTVRSALGQFGHCFERSCQADLTTFRFATSSMMEDIARQARERNAFVVYTLVDPVANSLLAKYCEELEVESHDLWSPLLEKMEGYFDTSRLGVPGRRQYADESYMSMIDCIEYSRLFDDGVHPQRWAEADFMIVGPSRSGKTPLSFFMAQRGYKVANYPLVTGETPPDELWKFPQDRVFALTIEPKKLAGIRSIRMKSLKMSPKSTYGSLGAIREEVNWCTKLYRMHPQWTVLDTTDTGIEENCAMILKHLDSIGVAGRVSVSDNPSAI